MLDNQKFNFFILIVLLIVNASLLGAVIYFFMEDYHQCSLNPLVFGLNNIEENNQDSMALCTCAVSKYGYSSEFIVNSKNITPIHQINEVYVEFIDYDELFKGLVVSD